jgi:hypothetical protein
MKTLAVVTIVGFLLLLTILLVRGHKCRSTENLSPVYADWDREDQPPAEIPGVDRRLQAELNSPLYSSDGDW